MFNLPKLEELESFEDKNLPLKKKLTNALFRTKESPSNSDTEDGEPITKRQKFINIRELFKDGLPETKNLPLSISYIFKGPEVPGTFDPVAAKKLGLPPGPNYAKLKKGISVETPDGVTIHPDQCVGPSKPSAYFVVVDCPSPDYIDNLINSSKFDKHYASGDKKNSPKLIIHNLGEGIITDERYINWMNKFSPTVEHLINSIDVCGEPIQHVRQAYQQCALSKIDDKMFSPPYYNNSAKVDLQKVKGLPKLVKPSTQLLSYEIEPKTKLLPAPKDFLFDHKDNKGKYAKLLSKVNVNKKELEAIKSRQSQANPDSIDLDDEVEDNNGETDNLPFISTMGTGSSIPSIDRNVSCHLLTIPNQGTCIFDAGEGSLGQLYRHLGSNNFKHPKLNLNLHSALSQLKLLYVSHMHADHHLGIISILTYIKKNFSEDKETRRVLCAPYKLWEHLREYSGVEDLGLNNWTFVNNHYLQLDHHFELSKEQRQFRDRGLKILNESLGLENLVTCTVHHIPAAYGVRLTHKNGWSFCYSGDTRPDGKLVEIGKNTTLLLHEATFDNDPVDQAHAIKKKHSTIGEAISIGKQMSAEHVLLTHFSQKYPSISKLNRFLGTSSAPSFDLMCLKLDETQLANDYIRVIQKLEGSVKLDDLVELEEI